MEIPLSRDAAMGSATWRDVSVVSAIMVWPDDKEAQERWVAAEDFEQRFWRKDTMQAPELRRLAQDAYDKIPRVEELADQAQDRVTQGNILGSIVLSAIRAVHVMPEQSSMTNIRRALCDRFAGTEFQVRPRTIENKCGPFYRFRCVAHLWAALRFVGRDYAQSPHPDLLLFFLGLAEEIRHWAETSKAPKSNSPIMRPGEAVRLPAEFAGMPRPPLDFTIPRSPDSEA